MNIVIEQNFRIKERVVQEVGEACRIPYLKAEQARRGAVRLASTTYCYDSSALVVTKIANVTKLTKC